MFHHVFRLNEGQVTYGQAHHLPSFFYLQLSFLWLVATALLVVAIFVILLPTLHKKLNTSFLGLTTLLCGVVCGYGLIIPDWQVGYMTIPSTEDVFYRNSPLLINHEMMSNNSAIMNQNFTNINNQTTNILNSTVSIFNDKINMAMASADIGLRIGLDGSNFTLIHAMKEIIIQNWNARIEFTDLDDMYIQYRKSLKKGYPIAILELQEQVAGCSLVGEDGFQWPFHLRRAGYYCSWLLCATSILWMFSLLFLITLPRIGSGLLGVTGIMLILVTILYISLVPEVEGPAGVLRVMGYRMQLYYGSSFWLTLISGIWIASVGFIIFIIRTKNPLAFFTDYEMDADKLEAEVKRRQEEKKEEMETEKKFIEQREIIVHREENVEEPIIIEGLEILEEFSETAL